MKTHHRLLVADARDLSELGDATVQLVVTSPPYPMIEMWDPIFASMNPAVADALEQERGLDAFELMHSELDRVWAECLRVLSPGGLACINVGDATRSMSREFRLYHNHARIVTSMVALGFTVLPDILWRKPTNAPNKFMGSGMLPAGAYVTYEHEYILIFRKGGKRVFRTPAERDHRARSAFFWEERNLWFSDVWTDLRGTKQKLGPKKDRQRSGAFPLELPLRLIQMYSVYGDRVLDPFVGTGTTLAATVMSGRSGVGVEISGAIAELIDAKMHAALQSSGDHTQRRLVAHREFVTKRQALGKTLKHHNEPHDVPVVTRQERLLTLMEVVSLEGNLINGYWAQHETAQAKGQLSLL
jgi:DNA modification methylase